MKPLCLVLALVACHGAPEPTTSPAPHADEVPDDALSAIVLYASNAFLVVYHDETKDRVTPGAAIYKVPVPELTEGLQPGDRIALRTRVAGDALQVRHLQKRGRESVPDGAETTPHPIVGTVVNTAPGRITLDHEPVDGVMGAMVMSFLAPPDDAARARGGDRVQGRILKTPTGYALFDVRKVGEGSAELREDILPLKTGEVFPRTVVPVEDGSTVVIGEGQGIPTAITFLYTTCPDPAFCPALATRLGALQHEIAGEARIVAITIDPEVDQLHVLERYARGVGAEPGTWRFGRLEPEWLQRVALLSGMAVTVENGRIAHLMRMLVTDRDGTIIERYDDNNWPLDRVASQLRSGQPRPPPGQLGSRYDR